MRVGKSLVARSLALPHTIPSLHVLSSSSSYSCHRRFYAQHQSILRHTPCSSGAVSLRSVSRCDLPLQGSRSCAEACAVVRRFVTTGGASSSVPGASSSSLAETSVSITEVPTAAGTRLTAPHSPSSSSSSSSPTPPSPSSARTPRGSQQTAGSAIGKTKRSPDTSPPLKYKKKAPWGVQQLRDSWSEDAMSKRDRENMDERIRREYRYHPDEFRRHYLRYTAMLTLPCMAIGMSITYYKITGKPIWKADLQHVLNVLRAMDTSPRSKLYAYSLYESHTLPPHVEAYRRTHAAQREYDEKVFRLTHSAFQRPDEDALRQLELEEQLKAAAAAAEVEAAAMTAEE